jgi:hypothetical protein
MDRQNPAALPAGVTRRVREYLALLKTEDATFVQGVYLVGSVALGDFQEGLSDIDFVALVADVPSKSQLESLARIHAAMAASEGPHFDGFYIEWAKLGRVPALNEQAPFSVNGVFRAGDPCFEINPATWLCLAEHGIAVRGSPPQTFAVATDPAALVAFQINNLRTYWEPWIEQGSTALARKTADEAMDAAVLAWGVLGSLRIACTLGTGRIVSKSEAGQWGLNQYPAQWHSVIQDALLVRSGKVRELSVSRCLDGLKLMRYVVADALTAAKVWPERRTAPCAAHGGKLPDGL